MVSVRYAESAVTFEQTLDTALCSLRFLCSSAGPLRCPHNEVNAAKLFTFVRSAVPLPPRGSQSSGGGCNIQ